VELATAGGAWVFPGGKLESSDASPQALGRLRGLSDPSLPSHACLGNNLTADQAHGLFVAACRETFEEIGVVLARCESGEPCSREVFEHLQTLRAEVSQDPARFFALLEEWRLVLEPRRLVYWSRWITPSALQRRFDARFFVTMMPPWQRAICDSAEATEPLWLDLSSFVGLPDRDLIQAPPTRLSLAELADRLREHGTAEELLQREAGRWISPIMPKSIRDGNRAFAVMPWDPGYGVLPGDGVPPDGRLAERYRAFPSRIPAGPGPSSAPTLAP
jgi:8-oxo-dGTP pyrophosphatase MutT (NUDIX family)